MPEVVKHLVVIVAASKADEPHYKNIVDGLASFEVEVVVRIASAHKTAKHLLDLLQEYESDPRPKVYITVAGRSNALSGFVDGAVTAPVIACPPASETFAGFDVFSSLRMPSGIAPAVVLEPRNAALLAVKILALHSTELYEKVKIFQHALRHKILNDDNEHL